MDLQAFSISPFFLKDELFLKDEFQDRLEECAITTGLPLTRLWEDTRITDHMAVPSEEQAC